MFFLDFFSRTATSCKKKESLKNHCHTVDNTSYRALQIPYLNCMLKAEFFELITDSACFRVIAEKKRSVRLYHFFYS